MLKNRWKKVLLFLAITPALIIAGMILLLNFGGFQAQEIEAIPSDELHKKYSPEELKDDLDYLFTTLEEVHPKLYAFTGEEKIAAKIEAVKQALDQTATRTDFYQEVAPVVANLGDGHTYMHPPSEELEQAFEHGLTVFPLGVNIERGRAFVRATKLQKESSVTAGSELLSINGKETGAIIEELLKFISGEKDSFREKLLERHFNHLLWLVYGVEGSFEIETKNLDNGEQKEFIIKGVQAEKLPRRSREEIPYEFKMLPEYDAGYIDFRAFVDLEAFEVFLEDTFNTLKKEEVSHLVIDIRTNGGGNSRLGDIFLEYLTDEPFTQFAAIDLKVSEQIKSRYGTGGLFLYVQALLAGELPREGTILELPTEKTIPGEKPLRFDGQVYLLTGPYSFSSAVSFAAAIKHYDIGTLVGEETGGLLTTYGDVYRFALPNTYLPVGVAHKRFESPGSEANGDSGVKPHFEVTVTPEDLARGRDVVMEYVREIIEKSSAE